MNKKYLFIIFTLLSFTSTSSATTASTSSATTSTGSATNTSTGSATNTSTSSKTETTEALKVQKEKPLSNKKHVVFSLGTRNTISLFSDAEDASPGIGIGGQFRVQFNDKINSEWFADYITSSIGDYAVRTDYHIGWSLMFYPGKNINFNKTIQPYILAGHCFDYTELVQKSNVLNAQHRWSMAMQAGCGTHINLTRRFDFSLSSQYMLHFGKDLEAIPYEGKIIIQTDATSAIDGHLLLTFSINYKISRLN